MNKMNKEIAKEKIKTEEDFIYCPRLGNSLLKLVEKNPDGVDDERILKVLLIEKAQLDEYFMSAISKLRKYMDKE